MLSMGEWWGVSSDTLKFYDVEVEATEFFEFCGCLTCFFSVLP